jgi:threonine dehydratase
MEPDFKDITLARERLKGIISPSPLIRSNSLSGHLGAEIFLKLENLQETGSFKVRGAYNRLSQLNADERKVGVIVASAGNHALGVAWACSRLGIHATVVMPQEVSIRKLMAVKEYGTEIILFGTNFDDAYSRAIELSKETGKILIPAFDDPSVIAGQGTIGLENPEVLTEGTSIVVPVGGGGLIAGISLATKSLYPHVRVIGVQSRSCPSTIRSLEQRNPVAVDIAPTLADGIAVKRPGDLTFPLIQRHVNEVVDVTEEGIAGAVLMLLERVNVLAEGAGATPLAAVMEERNTVKTKRYILIISGGNIETHTIDRILQRGSIKMGRLVRLKINLLDVPGSLSKLLGLIAELRANILHIFHDRLALENPIQISRVELNLETRGPDHVKEIFDELTRAGYEFRRVL